MLNRKKSRLHDEPGISYLPFHMLSNFIQMSLKSCLEQPMPLVGQWPNGLGARTISSLVLYTGRIIQFK